MRFISAYYYKTTKNYIHNKIKYYSVAHKRSKHTRSTFLD